MARNRLLLGSAIALAAMAVSAPAQAGSNDLLLKRLHEKGILTDEEYQQLMAEEEAKVAAPAPPMDQAASALDDKRVVRMADLGSRHAGRRRHAQILGLGQWFLRP